MRRRRPVRLLLSLLFATTTTMTVVGVARSDAAAPREVMFVGNNWAGTASIVDAHTFEVLKTINVIPDKGQRLFQIYLSPVKLAFYLAIRQQVGQGHDQYVDDMFSNPDGTLVAVSRPSFADVVGISLATGKIVWRTPLKGHRADHMAESPDGTRLLVSDSTTSFVRELDMTNGHILRSFSSGDTPHESNYSPDGSLIYHASIGRIYTPTDPSEFCPLTDPTKGRQFFEIVDNATFTVLKRWDIGKKLKAAGYPCMSSAVRPMAIAPDQRYAYLQVSFLHGFVEFDMQQEKVLRLANLPNLVPNMPKSNYVLNSAHHGLAMNAAGTTLCAAGTMDGYAAIVDRASFAFTTIPVGDTPYWATNGPGGTQCWMSIAGDDKIDVIDYGTASIVAQIPVGDHPQRVRLGHVAASIANGW
jgi:DNA-binding beta-propeller fold protein YncE